MGTESTNIAGLLKQVYSDKEIENLQNMEKRTWNLLGKASDKPTGQGFYMPFTAQGNQKGQGSQNELEALRDPGNQVPLQWIVRPKIFTHNIRFSGLALALATGNEDSFATTMTYTTEEGLKDSFKELNQQLYRDGSGIIAQVNGAEIVGSTTIDFDNGTPTHFRVGEVIDIVTGVGVLEATTTVLAVDIENNQLTVTALLGAISDNSFIYRQNVWANAPTDGKELGGFPLVTDDGTLSTIYQGIDRTVYQAAQGITLSAGGANVSNDLLQRAISRVKIISGGRMPTKVFSNTSQFRKYLDVVTPQKTFNDKNKMDSGYEVVPTWNGKEWVEDTDCAFTDIYMLAPDYIKRYDVYSLRYDDNAEGILKYATGFDAFTAYGKYYGNVGSQVPNAHVRITNLAVPLF